MSPGAASKPMRWRSVGLALFGPAFLSPLALWASNAGKFVDVPVVLVAGALVWSITGVIVIAARARLAHHLLAAQAAILVFWGWAVVPEDLFDSPLIELSAAGVAVAVGAWVGWQLRSFDWLVSVLGAALGVAALSMAVTGFLGDRRIQDGQDPEKPAEFAGATPIDDLLILIVDGYASPEVLAEDFGFDVSGTIDRLEQSGFVVPTSTFSNYTVTHRSVPSLLRLAYLPSENNDNPAAVDYAEFGRRVMGGDVGLLAWMTDAGYDVTKFESGWEEDNCGRVQTCVSPPRSTSITAWILMGETPLRSLARQWIGHPYPRTAVATSRTLPGVVAAASANGRPDFILAHVLAPHDPYLLTSECVLDSGRDPRLLEVGPEAVSPDFDEQLRLAYLGQVGCVNRLIENVAESVRDTRTTVLITGDHGSEMLRQMFVPPEDWSEDQMIERFSIFVATRTVDGCEASGTSLMNVARSFVGCAVGVRFAPVDDRYFASSFQGGVSEVTDRMPTAAP